MTLRKASPNSWAIFNGDRRISPFFHGQKHHVIEDAQNWVSSWNWELIVEGEDEKF
ncbi:MAG: hypothetical protein HWN81_00355 [Candidatus Lokiarchaeota archaeon]|nr:hypothetical protein [Candidatus Lokiarchaeota archaeon]